MVMERDTDDKVEPSYDELKQFLAFYTERYLNIETVPLEKRPIASLDELEKTRPKAAAAGLRQAINDCIEMSLHFNNSDIEILDNDLRELGIVTISTLRRLYSKTYKRILSRGKIKNDTELHFIKNVLNDPTPKASDEIEKLEEMIAVYEER